MWPGHLVHHRKAASRGRPSPLNFNLEKLSPKKAEPIYVKLIATARDEVVGVLEVCDHFSALATTAARVAAVELHAFDDVERRGDEHGPIHGRLPVR